MTSTIYARAAGALAFFLVLVSGEWAESMRSITPGPNKQCLPPPNCQGAACCQMPDLCSFLHGLAEAKAGRDFYANKKNRASALKNSRAASCKAYDPSSTWNGVGTAPTSCATAVGSDSFADNQAAQQLKSDFEKKFEKRGDDYMDKHPCGQDAPGPLAVGYTTHDDCSVTADDPANVNQQRTCTEFIDAAQQHEEVHAAICKIVGGNDYDKGRQLVSEMSGKKNGTTSDMAYHAENERRGYARETEYLRDQLRSAVHRCSVAKHKPASKMPKLKAALDALGKK